MRTTLAFVFFFSLWLSRLGAQPENPQFVAEMEATLAIHDTASTVASEFKALDAFRALSAKYEQAWLPPYWTAYLCTQVARLKGRAPDFPEDVDAKALVHEAQRYFDQADKNLPDKNDVQKSDFHALQGFIYGWMGWIVADSEEQKERYRGLTTKEYQAAVRTNPDNPLLFVLFGINLMSNDAEYQEIVAARALLQYANEIFQQAPKRAMTTQWNQEFIPFWKERAEKKLAELLNKDES